MHCKPTLVRGHGYIIFTINYFTKWDKVSFTYVEDGKNVMLFLFNHIIDRFGIPQAIANHHGSHFMNQTTLKLSAKLGFFHDNSTPYHPESNGQVEEINKF